MSYKVAVTSIDSRHVNLGFAHIRRFLVFSVSGRKLTYLCSRENPSFVNSLDSSKTGIGETSRALSDCRAVLVSHLTPAEASTLNRKGIRAFTAAGPITKAIQQVVASGKVR